jgi:endoglucanase
LILDNHSFDPTVDTSPDIGDILVPVWTQMAQHYKDRSTYVYYEVLNEPHGVSDTTWNRIQQQVIDAIRAFDQTHTIIVGPAGWNSYNNLELMPEYEDDNLIYTFHFYDPFLFTHQGASWTDPSLEPLAGLPFPYYASNMLSCPPELQNTWVSTELANYRNTGFSDHVKELIDIAVDFQTTRNVPLLCGEFGVYMPNSNDESRLYWYSLVRSYLELKGIAWTMRDYKGDFGLFEHGTEELIDYDLDIPLVLALGFANLPQKIRPDVNGFDFYLDDIGPNIIEPEQPGRGLLDLYSRENPASGYFCIHWTGVEQNKKVKFRFSPVKNLSALVDEGFAIHFWVRCDNPNARFDLGFLDTKTDEPNDHPWYMYYTVDGNIADWDGEWNHLQIPLNEFSELGSYDRWADGIWFDPVGAFDWAAIQQFTIVTQYDLEGVDLYFDDIRVAEPDLTVDPNRPVSSIPTKVDLSANGEVEPGWIDLNSGGNRNFVDIERRFLNEASFDDDFIIKFVKTEPRNRAQVSNSVPLHDLLEDGFKGGAFVDMQIKNLTAGEYTITTYHHDSMENVVNGNGTINITVSDANGTRIAVDHLQQGWGTEPTAVASATFTFVSNGTDDVFITFRSNNDGIRSGAFLNGFELGLLK